ncbi:MAG: ATP-binding protein [Anaerolineae bacterium]|jgi:hypothetical protein|nr:ATP-binding protein [Anaerolineae bacterium]
MNNLRPFAPQTPYAVGREQELHALATALNDSSGKSAFLYFVGPGGIGKTRLIEEATKHTPPTVLISPVIDLYHAEAHSVAGLERLLVTGLDPEAKHFSGYRAQVARIEKRQSGGVKITPEEQAALTQTFVQEYAQLVAKKRLCLRFDTTELIQRESDRVQEICQLEASYLEIREWLLNTLPQLQNTVIILGGRRPAPLCDELKTIAETREDLAFQRFELGGLPPSACQAYLAVLQQQEPRLQDIPPAIWEQAWRYTQGHPIRLSLVIDLVLNGQSIAELFPPNLASVTETLPVSEIDSYLIEQLLTTPEPARTLFIYLALARKGLDVELLHHLEPTWSPEECAEQLEALQRFTFVKQHTGTPQLFIHDELYTLFDRYILRDRAEYLQTYLRINEYQREHLAGEAALAPLLKPDILYYALQIDPWDGFWRTYLPWAEEAVRAGDSALDMRLRDALLHFRRDTAADPWVARRLPTELLERDAAVRWCRRYLSAGEHKRSLQIAQRIHDDGLLYQKPLQNAALTIAQAEAALYAAQEDEIDVENLLQTAIRALKAWEPSSENDPRSWWRARLLGRAHNNLGYRYWVLGQNAWAIEEFKHAIWRFREADIKDEMAATLTNLGFVFAEQGLTTEAETALQDAIHLRKDGPKLPLAFSLNTMGLAYTHNNRPGQGARRCEAALQIFEELQQPRGAGLAHLALGLAYRMRGEGWKDDDWSPTEAEEFFETARRHLFGARDIFDATVQEPVRLWEAYNELGSLYCDWAYLVAERDGRANAAEHYRCAVEYLETSVGIAEKEKELRRQLADSLDDLSQVYGDMGDAEKCQAYVDRVLQSIPGAYRLTPEGFTNAPDPAVEEWWRLLGKVHLGEAVRKVKQTVNDKDETLSNEQRDRLLDEVAEQYAYAVAYFLRYSPQSDYLGRSLKSIQKHIKTLNTARIERMYVAIQKFSEERGINLDRLLHLMENTMGREPEQV